MNFFEKLLLVVGGKAILDNVCENLECRKEVKKGLKAIEEKRKRAIKRTVHKCAKLKAQYEKKMEELEEFDRKHPIPSVSDDQLSPEDLKVVQSVRSGDLEYCNKYLEEQNRILDEKLSIL